MHKLRNEFAIELKHTVLPAETRARPFAGMIQLELGSRHPASAPPPPLGQRRCWRTICIGCWVSGCQLSTCTLHAYLADAARVGGSSLESGRPPPGAAPSGFLFPAPNRTAVSSCLPVEPIQRQRLAQAR